MREIKKVVVIGPESTGKSTLCAALAQHFGTIWCIEYARNYLLQHGMAYTFETLAVIGKGQLAEEEKAIAELNYKTFATAVAPLLFIDTDMYVMKVWCEYVFGKCHSFMLDEIAIRHYDLYLLCNTDLPWVKDELREYPDEKTRLELFAIYKDILVNQNTPWVEIKGTHNERLLTAIAAVNQYCFL